MFEAHKARKSEARVQRIGAKLVDAYPDMDPKRAQNRARKLLTDSPNLPEAYAAEALILGVRNARAYEGMIRENRS